MMERDLDSDEGPGPETSDEEPEPTNDGRVQGPVLSEPQPEQVPVPAAPQPEPEPTGPIIYDDDTSNIVCVPTVCHGH